MVRIITYITLILLLVAGGIFLFLYENTTEVVVSEAGDNGGELALTATSSRPELSREPPPPPPPPPKPLANPPSTIKAVYATNWSAGTRSRVDYLVDLIGATELNAIVVDVKDYSGYVGYDTAVPEVEEYNAKEIRIANIDDLVRRLHEKNIYAIARVTIFQDPRLSLARPDLAVQNKETGGIWTDRKGLGWMDPASKEVWDYNIKIVRDVLSHGFDEINFDYIRFPSDGDLSAIAYPFWDGVTPRNEVMRDFYRYLRKELGDAKISADLFGQSTVDFGDLGIGQIIEDAYESFDYVSPMVYPSHYISGFLDFQNPAVHPYEVVNYSISRAAARLRDYTLGIGNSTSTATSTPETLPASPQVKSKLRPWLQAFDLGAEYTPEMVRLQIDAVYDVPTSTLEFIDGFMLWNPSNIYDRRALFLE
ncbi:MAG: putative glycoside hydrolase [Patescibacteria group bacterium]|nr:putative glycoside hydrolase [Patescibacteria group bacterium]